LAAPLLPAAALARAAPLRRRPRRLAAAPLLARDDDVVRRLRGEGAEPAFRRPAVRRLRALGPAARALLPLRVEHAAALVRVRSCLLHVPVRAAVGGGARRAARRGQATAGERRLVSGIG